jgi:hypothetical protein
LFEESQWSSGFGVVGNEESRGEIATATPAAEVPARDEPQLDDRKIPASSSTTTRRTQSVLGRSELHSFATLPNARLWSAFTN